MTSITGRSPSFVSRFLRHRAAALGLGLATFAPVVAAAPAHADQRIVGGRPESRWPAVGALVVDGEWFCTGTVIGPRVVLTAAHCLEGMDDLEFFVGTDANVLGSGRTVRAASLHIHPNYAARDDYDIGVVLLAEDADVSPIPARLEPISDAIIGKTATFVGFGIVSEGGEGGEKRSVEIPIKEVNDFFIGYATPERNTCSGDSGGPALMDLGRGLEVVGVTSWGDAACADFGYNTRSDIFADWLGAFLDGHIPDANDVPPPVTGGDDDFELDGLESGDGDICAELGWYDDDYCDEDCARPDPDCDGGAGGGDDGWDDDAGWDEDDIGSDDELDFGNDDESDALPNTQGCSAGVGGSFAGLMAGLAFVAARLGLRQRRV